jgi:hypothetical protein
VEFLRREAKGAGGTIPHPSPSDADSREIREDTAVSR